MDKWLSSFSVKEVDTSHSDHDEPELSDLDELCSIGGEESDMEKQGQSALSTKRQWQKKVPAKFRDSAFVTGSTEAKFEAEMRDSKLMHGHNLYEQALVAIIIIMLQHGNYYVSHRLLARAL